MTYFLDSKMHRTSSKLWIFNLFLLFKLTKNYLNFNTVSRIFYARKEVSLLTTINDMQWILFDNWWARQVVQSNSQVVYCITKSSKIYGN